MVMQLKLGPGSGRDSLIPGQLQQQPWLQPQPQWKEVVVLEGAPTITTNPGGPAALMTLRAAGEAGGGRGSGQRRRKSTTVRAAFLIAPTSCPVALRRRF